MWFATFPQSVLNLCFLCTMSLVASHKPEANKIPVILKDVLLVLSSLKKTPSVAIFWTLSLPPFSTSWAYLEGNGYAQEPLCCHSGTHLITSFLGDPLEFDVTSNHHLYIHLAVRMGWGLEETVHLHRIIQDPPMFIHDSLHVKTHGWHLGPISSLNFSPKKDGGVVYCKKALSQTFIS